MKLCENQNKTLLSGCFACVHQTQCYSKEERDAFEEQCRSHTCSLDDEILF